MKIPFTILNGSLLALLFAAAADAQRPGRVRRPAAGRNDAVLTRLLAKYDADGSGSIERKEYPRGDTAFANLDRDRNGRIDRADLAVRNRSRPARPTVEAPKVGDAAPDFELPFAGDDERTQKLSDLAGDKPVALIFGSYT